MDRVLDWLGVGTFVMLAAVFVPLERVLPLREQRVLRAGLVDDLVYWVLNRLLITLGITLIIVVATATVGRLVPDALKQAVGGLPLVVQVPLAILAMDLGFYAVHRMFHRVPWLWQFHAVHHSIEQMDWLAGVRVHAVDQILTKGCSLLPLLLFGFADAAIGAAGLVYLWQSHFVHANLRIRLGPLRWLVAGPEFHHWHHSRDREAWDKNFAGQLPFLDRLFGTAYLPAGRVPSGYGAGDPVPRGFVEQFAYPLRRVAAMARGRLPGPE